MEKMTTAQNCNCYGIFMNNILLIYDSLRCHISRLMIRFRINSVSQSNIVRADFLVKILIFQKTALNSKENSQPVRFTLD